jgi:hypothetical protein
MRFSSYGLFVAAMGYSAADPSVIERGDNTEWRVSRNGNAYRGSGNGHTRVTICHSKKTGQIGYVWNVGSDRGWKGPFASVEEAMDHADQDIFGE